MVFSVSFIANIVFDGVDARVEAHGVLLDDDLLLDECVDLLFEEVALVDVVDLQLLVVFLQVGNVFDDLLQDVVGRLRRVVLESCALRSQELHFFLIVVQKFDRFFGIPLRTVFGFDRPKRFHLRQVR